MVLVITNINLMQHAQRFSIFIFAERSSCILVDMMDLHLILLKAVYETSMS